MTEWQVHETAQATLLHAARAPARFDVSAHVLLEGVAGDARVRRRLAHQIRQDIWRACRGVRGFRPVIEVSTTATGIAMRAGGSLATRSGHAATLTQAVDHVLSCPANHRRWLAYATRRRRGS